MIKKLPIILVFATFFCSAQNRISFSYDNAGNQIVRSLCLNCQTAKSVRAIDEVAAIEEEDLKTFFPEDQLSYYPNPVKEELFLTWQVAENNVVNSIQVFNINGQMLNSFVKSDVRDNKQNISFDHYPSGIYVVSLQYKDGSQKTIKVIKQ